MTSGQPLPKNQPGQRALRLVAPSQEVSPSPTALEAPSTSPTLRRLQRELEAARSEAQSLHELLEELPAILEKKFQLRLQALLYEQQQLEQENASLQGHLLGLLRGDGSAFAPPQLLPEATVEANFTPAREDAPITQGLGLRRALRLRHL